MGKPSRRWWQAAVLAALGMLVATSVSAQRFDVARLDGDPLPLQVLSGELRNDFASVEGQSVHETSRRPRWWRLTAREAISPADAPHLILRFPYLNHVEVWRPGEVMPLRRGLVGDDADPGFSTRALVVPLPQGLATGESIYLRVHALTPTPMYVDVEPLAQVHREDLSHVALRTFVLGTLAVLAILAIGFWIGIGERAYAYLFLTLAAQAFYLASVGGEVRMVPWLADLIGADPRVGRMFGLLGVLASNSFVALYLNLPERHPRLMRALHGCNAALLLLLLATVGSAANVLGVLASAVFLASAVATFVASIAGALQRQREAYFMVLSWTPMLVLAVLRMGELLGGWRNPEWMEYAFPIGLAMGGLALTIGLTDHMHQLRRDRDHASHMATYDVLTGALTRSAITERLDALVDAAQRGRRPLSVVFFDIDRFKRINDEFGHRVGDQTLRIVALRTRNRLRTYDLFGRYGGDEVLVVLPDTQLREALCVAENLRAAVNCRPLSIDNRLFNATLSLGVAELHHGETVEKLLERADAALYASKETGRDRVTGYTASRLRTTAAAPVANTANAQNASTIF
ncbi:sensor domain-containing diguanylate cyclase [Lysobacter panacisoli]|uniref:diguanylate cyclase n=1 Tax=Lysobacter panacisoli TaxID=1255263 RepID=A0ABP9LMC5_9GAMM|nr:diguanylate cyclase [Lysobacter panacisoli]